MLHIKFQGHRSIGSGEKRILKAITIYGHDGYIGHMTGASERFRHWGGVFDERRRREC